MQRSLCLNSPGDVYWHCARDLRPGPAPHAKTLVTPDHPHTRRLARLLEGVDQSFHLMFFHPNLYHWVQQRTRTDISTAFPSDVAVSPRTRDQRFQTQFELTQEEHTKQTCFFCSVCSHTYARHCKETSCNFTDSSQLAFPIPHQDSRAVPDRGKRQDRGKTRFQISYKSS